MKRPCPDPEAAQALIAQEPEPEGSPHCLTLDCPTSLPEGGRSASPPV